MSLHASILPLFLPFVLTAFAWLDARNPLVALLYLLRDEHHILKFYTTMIVPPGQARKIYQALKDKGLPVALVQYEGEQHGFRKAQNIKFTIEQQMMFFARTVGQFQVADPISPIKIDNLD